MNWFNTIAILLAAYLAVFFQATFNEVRHFIGVQVDLLPGLVVYAALSGGIVTLTLVAVLGGLWFDALSANPIGLSILPLFAIGLFIQHSREFILRDQPYAQMLIGFTASALAPLGGLLILVNTGTKPLLGWFSLWQWIVMSVVGAVLTPLWFWVFDVVGRVLNYRPIGEIGFRHDREIKREAMIVFDQLNKNDPHLRTVTWGVLAGLGVLFAGLWWVQVVSHKRYAESQKTQSFRTVRIPAVRGKILDRLGAAVAENRPSYNVVLYLDELRDQFRAEYARARAPRLVTNSLPFWKRWAGVDPVKREYTKLTREQRVALERACRYRVASNAVGRIAAALQQPIPFGFDKFMRHYTNQLALALPVIENLDGKQLARLLEGRETPPGIDIETQPLRFYPSGSLAAHIVGYLRPDNSSMEGEVADFNFRLPDYRGRVGIEGSFDADLRGKAGVKSVLVNNLGYRQTETIWTPAEPGRNVWLTIDAGIQAAAEAALQSVPGMNNPRGAVIVLDPVEGNILAMASAPAYDPNWFIPNFSPETARWMGDEHLKPELNRPIYASYHPGSIFKIVTGISALEHGLDPFEKIWNPGWIKVTGRRDPIKDLAAANHYDFRDAFIHSSNTYFITNGIRHGDIAGLVRLARRLHLGEKTDLMPYQEVRGSFPLNAVKGRGWVDADTALLCIGQGKVSVTPLQMAIMVAAVANGGRVLWPRLVDRVEPAEPHSDEPRRIYPPRPPRDDLGVSARSLQITREAMLADVESPGGTGSKAFVEGFRVCGKTGTAQVTNPRGDVVDHTVWFASYAPFENPRYVVVLMVESGASGGGTCAPAVGKIYKAIQKLEQQGRPIMARVP